MNQEDIEIKSSWKLNERHYGALQGLNKEETKLWRRSFDETTIIR